jgi:hypothetical protein
VYRSIELDLDEDEFRRFLRETFLDGLLVLVECGPVDLCVAGEGGEVARHFKLPQVIKLRMDLCVKLRSKQLEVKEKLCLLLLWEVRAGSVTQLRNGFRKMATK